MVSFLTVIFVLATSQYTAAYPFTKLSPAPRLIEPCPSENSVNIIAWLLSMPGVRTHVGTEFKNCEISLRSLRMPQNFFDLMKNCIERVKLSSAFAVMVFVFAGSVFTARYLRLNKDTCRPSYLPCPLFIQVLHVP